jgi:hypothetical protein
LSIKQFRQVYNQLAFPFSPPEDLRQIAYDFSLTLEIIHRNPEYFSALNTVIESPTFEATSTDLLENLPPNSSYNKQCDMLFSNTFKHLKSKGFDKAIYNWGKQTSIYYQYVDKKKFSNLRALGIWIHLLREWAVLKWIQNPSSPEQHYSEWDVLINKYSRIYSKKNLVLNPMPLSTVSQKHLQVIILSHESSKLLLKTTMNQIMASSKSLWDDYALRAGGANVWIKAESNYQLNLKVWKEMLNLLSPNEVSALEQWGLQYKDQYRGLTGILSDL